MALHHVEWSCGRHRNSPFLFLVILVYSFPVTSIVVDRVVRTSSTPLRAVQVLLALRRRTEEPMVVLHWANLIAFIAAVASGKFAFSGYRCL